MGQALNLAGIPDDMDDSTLEPQLQFSRSRGGILRKGAHAIPGYGCLTQNINADPLGLYRVSGKLVSPIPKQPVVPAAKYRMQPGLK